MRLRVPKLTKHFESSDEKDLIQKTVGFMKEFEIIELLMDDSKEFYNQRYSKNTPDIEVSEKILMVNRKNSIQFLKIRVRLRLVL